MAAGFPTSQPLSQPASRPRAPTSQTRNARFATILTALSVASGGSTAEAVQPRVHPGVHRTLRKAGAVNLILELAPTTEGFKESADSSRSAKIDALANKLQTQSTITGSEVTKLLSQESSSLHGGFKSFWISNQVYSEGASFELVGKLVGLDSIGTIREQFVVRFDKPSSLSAATESSDRYPGDFPNSFSIGAITSAIAFASFSRKSSGLSGRHKPDLVALGQLFHSSVPGGHSAYGLGTGANMAVPHVAVAVALIVSVHPDLAVDEVKIVLYTATDQRNLKATNYMCGGTSDCVWPQHPVRSRPCGCFERLGRPPASSLRRERGSVSSEHRL